MVTITLILSRKEETKCTWYSKKHFLCDFVMLTFIPYHFQDYLRLLVSWDSSSQCHHEVLKKSLDIVISVPEETWYLLLIFVPQVTEALGSNIVCPGLWLLGDKLNNVRALAFPALVCRHWQWRQGADAVSEAVWIRKAKEQESKRDWIQGK